MPLGLHSKKPMKTKTNLESIYLAWWLSDLANKKAEALIKKYQKK
jgi:hypothetical protein